jgi:hypothetical protein
LPFGQLEDEGVGRHVGLVSDCAWVVVYGDGWTECA